MVKRILTIIVLLLAIVYAGDYALLRYRIARNRNPYGSVPIQRYLAVTQKSGKPEFYFNPPTVETCVHSLFPHLGYAPCWYLNRRQVQRVNM